MLLTGPSKLRLTLRRRYRTGTGNQLPPPLSTSATANQLPTPSSNAATNGTSPRTDRNAEEERLDREERIKMMEAKFGQWEKGIQSLLEEYTGRVFIFSQHSSRISPPQRHDDDDDGNALSYEERDRKLQAYANLERLFGTHMDQKRSAVPIHNPLNVRKLDEQQIRSILNRYERELSPVTKEVLQERLQGLSPSQATSPSPSPNRSPIIAPKAKRRSLN